MSSPADRAAAAIGAVLDRGRAALTRSFTLQPVAGVSVVVNPEGTRWSLRRLLNTKLAHHEYRRGHTRLRSRPLKLTVEATNGCNLQCPACFTGVGQVGRRRGAMSGELYNRLIDELGPYLLEVEFTNWGEPLLAKNLDDMIERASRHGVSTSFTSNLSVPLSAPRAERLVRSGLKVLGASIDGANQTTYEQYRVGGDLEKVLANCRLIQETKARLGSRTPRLIWSLHVFPHNTGDVEVARQMAAELGMDFAASKAWGSGDDTQPLPPHRCSSLWYHAVVHNDGGVGTCCVQFYNEHDLDRVAVSETAPAGGGFLEVWNSPQRQTARRLFVEGRGETSRDLLCHNCPITLAWQAERAHLEGGRSPASFRSPQQVNDIFEFFFWRSRPGREDPREGERGNTLTNG